MDGRTLPSPNTILAFTVFVFAAQFSFGKASVLAAFEVNVFLLAHGFRLAWLWAASEFSVLRYVA